jgi:hypothetical protein
MLFNIRSSNASADAVGMPALRSCLATKHNGAPWKSEEQLQKAFSNFMRALEKKGMVEPGLTLHGLPVSFAAGIKRKRKRAMSNAGGCGGDRDEWMGAHHTRHVENELKVIQAFGPPKRRKKKK